MPEMMREIKAYTRAVSRNISGVSRTISYEMLAASCLMQEGWQVYLPLLDYGQKTDLLIAEGQRYYRILVKTVANAEQAIENRWQGSAIHYVFVFVREHGAGSDFSGFVMPAFSDNARRLDHEEHYSFSSRSQFLKAFHKLPAP